jgi:hypothetical protein
MDENFNKNELCKKCSCSSWRCPAQWWDDNGTPMKNCDHQSCEEIPVITSFCYQPKEDFEQ